MVPTILLVGCGNFGKHHLRVLKTLHAKKSIHLKGVVVRSTSSAKTLQKKENIPVYTKLTPTLLQEVDLVDITTPASTHVVLARQCLPYAHVLVEKPLALTTQDIQKLQKQAQQHNKVLMVGHIFRFNKAVQALPTLLKKYKPYHIEGRFLGKGTPSPDCGVLPTFLHLFDILDYVLLQQPKQVYAQGTKDHVSVSINYPTQTAHLSLGWIGAQKERTLLFRCEKIDIHVDLLTQTITLLKDGRKKKTVYPHKEPLTLEIEHFITATQKKINYPDATLALRIQHLIIAAEQSLKTQRAVTL